MNSLVILNQLFQSLSQILLKLHRFVIWCLSEVLSVMEKNGGYTNQQTNKYHKAGGEPNRWTL